MKKSFVLLAALLAIAMLFVSCEPQPRAATPEEIAIVSTLYGGASLAATLTLEGVTKTNDGASFSNVKYSKMVLNGTWKTTKTDTGYKNILNLISGTKLDGKNHTLKVTVTEESTVVVLDGYKLDGIKL